MQTSVPDPAALSPFKLPATLDLAAAEDLLAAVRDLQTQPRARIDASVVEVLTLPCVQVLLAARQCCPHLSIQNPSPAFTSALEDLGLDCGALCSAGSAAPPEAEIAADSSTIEPVEALADAGSPAVAPVEQNPVQADGGSPVVETAEQDPVQVENGCMTRRILTIDDSKTIRDMLMLTLADAGFEVLQAVDGQDGLDVLDREQVDVVITDINMPRMDGYEVIRQLRSDSAHKSTPILVLTTESEADKKNLARMAGATGWMVKPFDPERLIATINKVAPSGGSTMHERQ
jgi:two-component system, chemotaxis family, chemotaxis protein CheY